MHLPSLLRQVTGPFLYVSWSMYPLLFMAIESKIATDCLGFQFRMLTMCFSGIATMKLYLWLVVWKLSSQYSELVDYNKKKFTKIIFVHQLLFSMIEITLFLSALNFENKDDNASCQYPSVSAFRSIFPLWSGSHIMGGILMWLFNLKVFFKYATDPVYISQSLNQKVLSAISLTATFSILPSLLEVANTLPVWNILALGLDWIISTIFFVGFALEANTRASMNIPYVRTFTLHLLRSEIIHYAILAIASTLSMGAQTLLLRGYYEKNPGKPPCLFFSSLIGESSAFAYLLLFGYAGFKYRQLWNEIRLQEYQIAEELEELEEKLTPDPVNHIVVENQEGCIICLEDYKVSDQVITLNPCKHVYHFTCLKNWVQDKHNTCPKCRAKIVV